MPFQQDTSMTGKYLEAIVAVLAALVGFLGFTKPGHQMLYKLGFSAACSSSDGCND